MAGFTLRRAREEIFIQCRCVHLVDARLLGGIRRRVPSEQRQDAESGQGRDTAAAAPFIPQLLTAAVLRSRAVCFWIAVATFLCLLFCWR